MWKNKKNILKCVRLAAEMWLKPKLLMKSWLNALI